ncbi:MAG TPA: sigma-70 family RNA polymerase sigma factor [Actinomycetota bacterium]
MERTTAHLGDQTRDQGSLLEDLYADHALRAFRLAYLLTGSREAAEDVVQEAFLQVGDRLDSLRDLRAFPGYLRTVVLNLVRGRSRRMRRERLLTERAAILEPRTRREEVDIGQRERLWAALHLLPHRQRAALVLRYYEDLSERDAAMVMGTTVSAVKALVSRGTRALRAMLGDMREA